MTISNVLIIGSTSTIAKSISLLLAKRGCKDFVLIARNKSKNELFANQLKKDFSVNVKTYFFDLENPEITLPFEIYKPQFDLVLICPGYLSNTYIANNDFEEALKVIRINFSGLLPFLVNFTTPERIEKPGRLWVFTSVAADRGRPSNYPYGAAKAALSIFCEGLLLRCYKKPFSVRIIKAGYIDTPMALKTPKFLRIQSKKVAKYLLRNPNRRGIEYLPWWWSIVMFLVRIMPISIVSKL